MSSPPQDRNEAARLAEHHGHEEPSKPQSKVLYGYIRVVVGDETRATLLKAVLLGFCRSNGFVLSTVFTDFGVEDTVIARPGFASLLDVCSLVGSYGVLVPARMHLSAHGATLDLLTHQIRRTGSKLIVVDEVADVGPSKSGSNAHA